MNKDDIIENPLRTNEPDDEDNDKEKDKDKDKEECGISSDQQDQIEKAGAVTPAKGQHIIHCLTIIGQVEGHYILPQQNKTTKYEHVIPQLVAIDEDPQIEGLVIILNTVGGDVEAGLAIAELIAGMKKPTVSLVLGGGHSIGIPLAVAAKRSFIVPSATMTIHPVRMNGLVLGVPQTLSYFERMQDRITRFITTNSKISAERFKTLIMTIGELVMDVGTILDGDAAVREGLIDEVGSLSDVIKCLYDMIDEGKKENKENKAHHKEEKHNGKKDKVKKQENKHTNKTPNGKNNAAKNSIDNK